jgi:hypothetical protein
MALFESGRRRAWRAARTWFAAALASCLFLYAELPISAHEVPNDVLIQAILKPEGQRVRLLVRVPLIALRDMTWPFKAPDILDTSRAAAELHDAATLWLGDEQTLYEGDRALPSPTVAALRATLPSDRSFESYDQALALLSGPPPADTDQISIKEGFLDVLFEFPGTSETSRFSMEPRWGRLGVHALTRLHVLLPDGTQRTFELQGDPGLVRLDPTLGQTVRRFAAQGFRDLLASTDALLFLACLVLPFRRLRDAFVVMASFAAAHSVTLLAAASGLTPGVLWFPAFVDSAVALSIVYLALENIAGASVHRRRVAAAIFGLAYGFSFALALNPALQFSGAHVIPSMVAFNVGVEAAVLLAAAVMVSVLAVLFRVALPERVSVALLSALIAHTAWHWLTTRGALLAQYQFTMPDMTPAFFVDVVRWLMVLVTAAALTWLVGLLRENDHSRPRTDTL